MMKNDLLELELLGFYKFHSPEWVEFLRKRIEEELSGNVITPEAIKNTLNKVAWTINEKNPYLQ